MSGNLLLIGVGFMGGSFVIALRKGGFKGSIYGVDVNPKTLEKALELGVIDKGWTNLDSLENVDVNLVVLATPVRAFRRIAKSVKPLLSKQTILTDLGSVKGKLVFELERELGNKYVGAHPIAGTEKSGVQHSFGELFEGKRVILTPTERTDRSALEEVKNLWKSVGAVVEVMDPLLHDWVFGAVSHLPHAVAFALIDALTNMSRDVDLFKYPGAGFKDFTRIAASDPVMWRDIFLENKNNVLKAIEVYIDSLGRLRDLILTEEEERLTEYLQEARERRLNLE